MAKYKKLRRVNFILSVLSLSKEKSAKSHYSQSSIDKRNHLLLVKLRFLPPSLLNERLVVGTQFLLALWKRMTN